MADLPEWDLGRKTRMYGESSGSGTVNCSKITVAKYDPSLWTTEHGCRSQGVEMQNVDA